jgi:hypothetical protein
MVQTVTLELSALNGIPGVSGVEDVSFRIPELSDIREEIDQAVPALDEISREVDDVVRDALQDVDIFDGGVDQLLDDIGQELDDRLDDLVDDIQDEIDQALDDLDPLDLSGLEVDIQGSLFDIEQDFVDLLAAALDQADLVEVAQFPSLDELLGPLEEVQTALDDLEVPTAEDVAEEAVDQLTDALTDLAGGDLLADPDQFIDDQLDRITGSLVSEEARQDLQETIEEI